MTALIENHFALTTNLLKKTLQKARVRESVDDSYLNITYNSKPTVLDYSLQYKDEKAYLVVIFGSEPQEILLSEHKLTFGTRTYLTCGCGKRTNSLYLKLGYFACRECQKLRYRSTTINPTSDHGRFLQLQSKRLKLVELRAKIARPIYKTRYTKPFIHWLSLCSKAGIFDEAIRAMKTMEAIKGG